ncbi:MAG TPA: hypothetical protein VFE46_12930 [Pirellulales bacterium]|nr:hypothetical protein [Pirellulales bacterium]
MSSTAVGGTRLLKVTAGNIRNSHIYVHGHYDFFPADCVGPPRKTANGNGHQIQLLLEYINVDYQRR